MDAANANYCPWLKDIAEQFPSMAIEAFKTQLLCRVIVGRTRVQGDPWQERGYPHTLEMGDQLHQMFPRQFIAAAAQYIGKKHCVTIARKNELVSYVTIRIVLMHECEPSLIIGIGVPLRVAHGL